MMRALTWHGTNDVRVDTVSDPEIINPRDAIIKITSTAICGSDLHLYDGVIPGVAPGDVLGHEFMGEVVETGSASDLKKGQRVVVPFTISCGGCFHCKQQQYSACDNSNPAEKQDMSATLYGQPMAALFGYSHLTGGYSGGQAEYARVPFSFRTSSRPAGWRRKMPTSSPTIRLRCGAAARSDCSRSSRPS